MTRSRILMLTLIAAAVCVVSAGVGVADTKAPQTELPEGVPTDWWTSVQEDIRKSEYDVTWQETQLPDINAAYQAPNRAHNLRTYFTPDNIMITPRTSTDWVFGLSLTGYGFADDVRSVSEAEMSVSGNRVEYQRGCLTEWYVNSEDGLEQGFTIDAPPESESQPEQESWIAIKMDILGDLDANMNSASDAVELTTTGGVGVLRYGKLHAFDATGRELDARFALMESEIEILVNTSGAAYPITIDPLAQSPAWTAESNQSEDYFGWSVASAGDVNGDGYSDVIVGAHAYDNGQNNEGRAYVYHGSATGLSTSFAWTAESNQIDAYFGWSVASAGDVNGDGYSDVIVGARAYDNGETDEGRAYVYHGSATGLSTSSAWTAESNQFDAQFGYSVASAGDVNGDGYSDVIVGAYAYDNGETDEGRAYVYHGSATGLSTSYAWTAEGNQTDAYFGRLVASAGDVNGDGYSDVIIGARAYDGRAYVYHGSAAGLSTSFAWTAESNQSEDYFGWSVASAGDVNGDGYSDVIVGAFHSNDGVAYVYHGSATGLSTSSAWTAESNQFDAQLGYSVASAGDVNGDGYSDVIVGAAGIDGRAYVYHGSATGLSTSFAWTAESNQTEDYFGRSVASAGDVNGDGYSDVIVGAAHYDNGQNNEGRAYVYHGSATGLSTSFAWTAECNQIDAYFGRLVASAGDVNGDGYSDVIVGAHAYDNGQNNEGRAYVYHGSATGLSTSFAWTAESNQIDAYFGWSVASAGDVNGDGYSDVIVGARAYDNGQNNEGRAYVYHGSATGLSTSSAWTAESNQFDAQFGYSVASAGDVNGDGYSDVIVGAYAYDNGETDEGRAYVYHGSATGLSTSYAWTAEGNQTDAYFGRLVASAGDVNGDGYSDVIIGARAYDGRAYVYHGSATGLSTSFAWTAEGNQTEDYFGWSVASAGDVNGDGYSDVIVGVFYSNDGIAYVYHGSATGLSTSFAWTAESNQSSALQGWSVASAGDVNGDGYSDVIVGAHFFFGRAYVYHGSATGLSTSSAWTAESNQTDGHFGWSVASAGDVNGDGYSDVIVGAIYYSHDQSDDGRVFVYHGNGGSGLSLIPAQRKSDNSAPIAHLGRSDSVHEFRLTALGRTPYGRSKVKLEWEVKPLGTPFDGTGTQKSASWTDTGTAGANLNELVSSLTEDTCYHWRMRLLYHPASTPFQQHSRWFSQPWNGWQEADLRTPPAYSVGEGAPDPTTKNHFIDAYNRNGGINVLGSPTTEVHRAWGYLVQDFSGASGYAGGIIMYNPYKNYAYYIHGAIWERYYGLGGPGAETDIEFELGPPTSDIKPYIHTQPPEVSSHGTQFRYQNFEGGALNHKIDTGEVFEIHGAIFAKWGELGYAAHDLGLVTSDEREAALSPIGTEGRVSDFEDGHIYWHRTGGHSGESYETHGAIDVVYCAEGGSSGRLGFPVSDEYMNPSGYPQSDFEGGYITTTDWVNYYVHMNDDVEGPSLEITSPEDDFHTDEYRIDISGTASDDSGILYDKVGIASSGFEATPTTAKCDPITQEWNTNIPLVYGINIIRVIAWDNKHNPTEKTISVYCDPTDFRFVQITDVHIGCDPKSIIDPLSPLTDKAAKEVEESIRRFAETLKVIGNLNPKPTVLLITGDLVEWNDESFLSAFKAISKMEGHDISVYYIPGNHDRRKLNPLDDDNLVNYHKYISASDNYCFSQGGYRFIGLDSGKDYNVSVAIVPSIPPLIYDHSPESYGLSQGQIEFLQQEPKNTPKIIFMHHPAIEEIGNNDVKSVESVSEDPVPPNGPGGNDGCIAFRRPEFIDYCKEYNVQLVLTGHTHVDKFLDADGNPVRVYTNGYYGTVKPLFVQTRNVTKDTQGYLVVDVKDDNMRLFSPSGAYVHPSRYLCSITGPVNIHAYDSQDKHTGYGSVDVNIPESFYTGNYNGTAPDMPQMILLFNTTEEYRFEIVANLTEDEKTSPEIESFNFTVEQQTDNTRTTLAYLNVPLTENTTATLPINLTSTAYTMKIDHDGDGTTDETEDPDFNVTNYAPTASIIAPKTGLMFNASDPVEFNGTGRDPEDGILTNFSLVWYSDMNGVIDAGERFSTANLSTGMHMITLMINDSVNLVDTESVMINVVDRTPPSTITNLTLTPGTTWLNFTWTNPSDPDFNHIELYLNSTFLTNIPAPQNYYNITGLLPDTSYELSTRTVDINGNINLTWVNDTASTLPASGTTLNLYTGWNLISLPLMPEDTSITSLLSPINGNYSIVWEYNASNTSDHWKKYDPSAPFGNDLSNMEPGKGYWIMMISDDTLLISGTVPESTDINLKTGWNLIGYNSLESQPITDALSLITGNYSIVWAYDASDTADHWKKYDPNAPFGNDLANMEAGKGYWIMMTTDDILEI